MGWFLKESTMKTYPELEELIARAICHSRGSDPDRSAPDSQSSWPMWKDHRKSAQAVIQDLTKSGLILFSPSSWQKEKKYARR